MKVGVYARVSTSDKDQQSKTQLMPLWGYRQSRGWAIRWGYMDIPLANDLAERITWRELSDGKVA